MKYECLLFRVLRSVVTLFVLFAVDAHSETCQRYIENSSALCHSLNTTSSCTSLRLEIGTDLRSDVQCYVTLQIPIYVNCVDTFPQRTTIHCGNHNADEEDMIGCFVIPNNARNVTISLEGCLYRGGPVLTAWDCSDCNVSLVDVTIDGERWSTDGSSPIHTLDYPQLRLQGNERSRFSIERSTFRNSSQALRLNMLERCILRNVSVDFVRGIGKSYTGALDMRRLSNADVEYVTMSNSSNSLLNGNHVHDFGGCMIIDGDNISLRHSVFDECRSIGSGAAVGMNINGNSWIENVTVYNSTAEMSGGGLYMAVFGSLNFIVRDIRAYGVKARFLGGGIYISFESRAAEAKVSMSNLYVESEGGNGCFCIARNCENCSDSRTNVIDIRNMVLRGCAVFRPNNVPLIQDIVLSRARYSTQSNSPRIFDREMTNLSSTKTKTTTKSFPVNQSISSNLPMKLSIRGTNKNVPKMVNGIVILEMVASVLTQDTAAVASMEGVIFLGMSSCAPSNVQFSSDGAWIASPLQRIIGVTLLPNDPVTEPVLYNIILSVSLFVGPLLVLALMVSSGHSKSKFPTWSAAMDTCRYPSIPIVIQLVVLQGAMYHIVKTFQQRDSSGLSVAIGALCILLYPVLNLMYLVMWWQKWRDSDDSPQYHRYPILARHSVRFAFLSKVLLPVGFWLPTAHRHTVLYTTYADYVFETNVVFVVHYVMVGGLTSVTASGQSGCVAVMVSLAVSFFGLGLYLLLRRPFLSISGCYFKGLANVLNAVVCILFVSDDEPSIVVIDAVVIVISILCMLDLLCVGSDVLYQMCYINEDEKMRDTRKDTVCVEFQDFASAESSFEKELLPPTGGEYSVKSRDIQL